MGMRAIVVGCVLAVLVSGCATPYEQEGLLGGLNETQVGPNVWRISFQGNGFTTTDRAEDFVLLRGADLALKNGFSYFGLASSRVDKSYGAITTPVTTTTNANAYVVGNTAYGSATSTSYGGNTIFVSYPSANNTVVMFRDKPDVAGVVYDARFVCKSVGAKYKVSCGV
jgi:hypothetical protein